LEGTKTNDEGTETSVVNEQTDAWLRSAAADAVTQDQHEKGCTCLPGPIMDVDLTVLNEEDRTLSARVRITHLMGCDLERREKARWN